MQWQYLMAVPIRKQIDDIDQVTQYVKDNFSYDMTNTKMLPQLIDGLREKGYSPELLN